MKKKLAVLSMTAALTAGTLAGSAMPVLAEADTSEEVNLVMYVISDRPAGQDEVDAHINEVLKEKLNATLTINWIPWSDYINKYPLLFSSGEQFDLAYCATWLNFSQLAQKGAFMNLDELWPEYAPTNWANTADSAKQQATVDGHLYCVPTQLATYRAFGPMYRTDIMEGTDWDGVMETFEDVEEYCDIVKETHPELQPIDIYSAGPEWDGTWMLNKGYLPAKGSTNDFLWFNPSEENPSVITYYEAEETPEFLEMMTRWNEKGFFTKSALSDTDSTKLQNGLAAMKTHNLDTFSGQYILHPEYQLEYADLASGSAHLPFTQDCMTISNTSQNPERALMFWDLLTSDQELYDAFMYGIEGTSYELNDEGQFTMLNSDLYATSAMWAARTSGLNRNQVGTPASFSEWQANFEERIAADDSWEKYAAFTIDTSAIETEFAACLNVHQQYWWPLSLAYTDAETGLAEYQEKLEAAGIEKVREEVQRQLDEYTASIS